MKKVRDATSALDKVDIAKVNDATSALDKVNIAKVNDATSALDGFVLTQSAPVTWDLDKFRFSEAFDAAAVFSKFDTTQAIDATAAFENVTKAVESSPVLTNQDRSNGKVFFSAGTTPAFDNFVKSFNPSPAFEKFVKSIDTTTAFSKFADPAISFPAFENFTKSLDSTPAFTNFANSVTSSEVINGFTRALDDSKVFESFPVDTREFATGAAAVAMTAADEIPAGDPEELERWVDALPDKFQRERLLKAFAVVAAFLAMVTYFEGHGGEVVIVSLFIYACLDWANSEVNEARGE